jgi:hypothetical protein
VLFPGRPYLGSKIPLNDIPFEVIGAIKAVGNGDNNDMNLKNRIPFSTMRQYFPVNVDQRSLLSLIIYQPGPAFISQDRPRDAIKVEPLVVNGDFGRKTEIWHLKSVRNGQDLNLSFIDFCSCGAYRLQGIPSRLEMPELHRFQPCLR